MQHNKQIFGNYAHYYDYLHQGKNYGQECDFIEQLIDTYRTPTEKSAYSIIDVGCGSGNHSLELSRRGYNVVGIDISEAMVKHATAKANTANLPVPFHCSDVNTFTPAEPYDAALAMFSVIGYQTSNQEQLRFLRSIRRLLKPDGLFICDFWYAPAVLSIGPETRIREITSGDYDILRVAKPELRPTDGTTVINYRVYVFNKDGEIVERFEEVHVIRYFSCNELHLLADMTGFNILRVCEFPDISTAVSINTWTAALAASAI